MRIDPDKSLNQIADEWLNDELKTSLPPPAAEEPAYMIRDFGQDVPLPPELEELRAGPIMMPTAPTPAQPTPPVTHNSRAQWSTPDMIVDKDPTQPTRRPETPFRRNVIDLCVMFLTVLCYAAPFAAVGLLADLTFWQTIKVSTVSVAITAAAAFTCHSVLKRLPN